ncbi:MAG: hypothetical protein QM718_14200 [Steroidobacteraceae bacterium]
MRRQIRIGLLVSRLLTSGLLISIALPALATQTITLSAPSYIRSGLPNDLPTTFLFDRNGSLLLVATSADADNKLQNFLNSNGRSIPVADQNCEKLKQLLTKVLAEEEITLSAILSKSNAFTLIGIRAGSSLGECAPCTSRHLMLLNAVNGKVALDAKYVVLSLENR